MKIKHTNTNIMKKKKDMIAIMSMITNIKMNKRLKI